MNSMVALSSYSKFIVVANVQQSAGGDAKAENVIIHDRINHGHQAELAARLH